MLKQGKELDGLVAEKVMGYTFSEKLRAWTTPDRGIDWLFAPPFSTEMAAAWEVVDRIKELSTFNGQQWPTRDPWVKFSSYFSSDSDGFNLCLWRVNPESICKAALAAIAYQIDSG